MKKKSVASAIIVAALISPSYAYAEEVIENPEVSEPAPEPAPEPVEDPREYPNVDTLPLPSQELISEDPWTNSSLDPEPNNSEIDPASQDEPEIWAIVDENGNTLNITSCDIDFCGSGWMPIAYDGLTPTQWARVVRQSSRDPQTGNHNSGHWGNYNFPSGTWTNEVDGSTYIIPEEYGQEPLCISNCPVPEEIIDNPEEIIDNPEDPLDPVTSTENVETLINVESRSFNVSPTLTKKEISFIKKFPTRKNIKWKSVWIIATNNDEKFVWKIRVAKRGKTKITLPAKYLDWNIFVNYTLVNNKKFSNKVFFV